MLKNLVFTTLLLLSSLSLFSQTPSGSKVRYQGAWYTCKDTATATSLDTASMLYMCRDSTFYGRSLGYWHPIAKMSSSGLFLKISDTASMLSNYPLIFGRPIPNFWRDKTWEVDGNSITAGANATTFDSSYAPRVANALGISYVDSALGGSIVRNGIYRQFKNASSTNPTTNYSAAFGINDLRAYTAVNLTVGIPNNITGIVEGLKTIVANRFMDSIRAASTLSQTGTWSTLSSSNNLSSKSLLKSLGNPLKSTASGSTLSYSVSLNKGQSIVIGTWGDTAAATLGSFSVTIDGVLYGSYNAANKANAYQYSVLSPVFDWRMPNVFIASNLASGVHSVVITTLSNLEVDIDYVGKMVTPQNASGVLLSHILQMTDYSIPLAGSATSARVDSANNNIDTLVGFFNKMGYYTIGAVATENFYNTANAPVDKLHPNNGGHAQIANAFLDKISQLASGNIYSGVNGVEIDGNKTVRLISPVINQKTQSGLNTNFNAPKNGSGYNQFSVDKIAKGYDNWGLSPDGTTTGNARILSSIGQFVVNGGSGIGVVVDSLGHTLVGTYTSNNRDKLQVLGKASVSDTAFFSTISTTGLIASGTITGTTLYNGLLGGAHNYQTLIWNNVFQDGYGPDFSGGTGKRAALRVSNWARDTVSLIVYANGDGRFFGIDSAASFTGAGTGLTGTAPALSIGGSAATVTTAAQPNITSLGTLVSLTVTGQTTSGTFVKNGGTASQALMADGSVKTATNANTASAIVARDASGDFNARNIAVSDVGTVTITASGLITGQAGLSLTGASATITNTTSNSIAGSQSLIHYNSSATGYGPYFSGGNSSNDALTVVDYTRSTIALSVKGDGKVYNGQNTTTFNTVSDRRVKENITPIASALATIDKLNPVTYDYTKAFAKKRNWDNAKGNYGFIAQEWEKVFPKYTTTTTDSIGGKLVTDFKGVDQTPLGPLNTAAIKELYQIVKEQATKIEELKAAIKALQK